MDCRERGSHALGVYPTHDTQHMEQQDWSKKKKQTQES